RDAEEDLGGFAALWHLDRLIALRPDDWLPHARRARIHLVEDRPGPAAAEYRRAEELGPPDALLAWYRYQESESRLREQGRSASRSAGEWTARASTLSRSPGAWPSIKAITRSAKASLTSRVQAGPRTRPAASPRITAGTARTMTHRTCLPSGARDGS